MRSDGMRLALAGAILALLALGTGCGQSSQAPFRIGVMTDCTGLAAATHDWTLAASELPLLQRGGKLAGKGPAGGVDGTKVAGRDVELVEACAESGVFGRMINAARQLVEVDRVDAVVGALGWSDAVVLREIARRYPTVPFLVAGSHAREVTAHLPARNLYRFTADVEQEQAGLATYAYRILGWTSAAIVAEDFPNSANGWGAAAAFSAEFCALGGSVERVWTPGFPGTAGPLLEQVPASVDGVVVLSVYGFGNPAAFIRAYLARHPDAKRSLLLGLWVYPPDDEPAYAKLWPDLRGVVARLSGIPDPSRPANTAYREAFARAFPGLPAGLASNLVVLPYYTAVEALLQALESTGGEPGADRGRLRAALASLRLETPTGPVHLDKNRQAVVPATLVRLTGTKPGPASFEPVLRIPAVDETLGGLFTANSSPTPRSTECSRATPPPWAR
jgi:branched-chain amino acid transport system substrate-binding protein